MVILQSESESPADFRNGRPSYNDLVRPQHCEIIFIWSATNWCDRCRHCRPCRSPRNHADPCSVWS